MLVFMPSHNKLALSRRITVTAFYFCFCGVLLFFFCKVVCDKEHWNLFEILIKKKEYIYFYCKKKCYK